MGSWQPMLNELCKNHKEKVILSTELFKYNQKGAKQIRYLCLTNYRLFNIRPTNITSIQSLGYAMDSSWNFQRRIRIKDIEAISIQKQGNEFVIHVPSRYDYRYETYPEKTDMRDLILQKIVECHLRI